MKLLFFILVCCLMAGCATSDVLNKHIYYAQKEHLRTTPFKKDLGYTYKKIAQQRKFRKAILKEFFKNAYHITDTVIIAEMYGKMALGYNISVNIVYRDTNYYYTKDYRGGKDMIIRKDYLYKDDGSHSFDIQKQVRDSIKHELWNAEPLHYGTDCNEENPIFITVLYPGGYIEPLYVRCWLTPEQIKMRANK